VGLVIFIQEVNKRGSFCTLEKTVYPESFYVYLLFLVYFKKYKLYRKLLFGIAAAAYSNSCFVVVLAVHVPV
jgi:hypothetical protein